MSRERSGSITPTRGGRFRVRLTLPAQGRKTYGIFDTRDEAEHELATALDVLHTDKIDDGETVLTFGEKWLNARDVKKLVRDPESDWSRWRNHIKKDPIAKIGLRSLRRRHVKAWLERVRGKVARQTAINCLNVMRGLLGAALDEEIIKLNPAAGLRLPREKRTVEAWTYATPDEQRALILVADNPERWIIAFAMGTGLRAGELVSLRLADLHVDGDEPHAIVRYGGPPSEPTKGGKIRRVPLFGIGLLAAREWLAALPGWAKKNPRGLVFPRMRGSFRDKAHVLKWSTWQDILEAAGIVRDFRWHDLRHTAGSSLVSGFWGRRWSMEEVRDFLGHESVTTTERYAHLSETALKRAAAETQAARSGTISFGPNWTPSSVARSENPQRSHWEPPSRFELETYGLRIPREGSAVPQESASGVQMESICRAYLIAVANGDPGAPLLAMQMGALLVADPRRAIEIAEAVLRASGEVPARPTNLRAVPR